MSNISSLSAPLSSMSAPLSSISGGQTSLPGGQNSLPGMMNQSMSPDIISSTTGGGGGGGGGFNGNSHHLGHQQQVFKTFLLVRGTLCFSFVENIGSSSPQKRLCDYRF